MNDTPPPSVPRWLVPAAIALTLVAVSKPLVVDEESYLWLGRTLSFADPYGWTREWQGRLGYAYAHPPLFLWWMKIVSSMEALPLARGLAGVPFALLWASASALWMRRTTRHPDLAALSLLGSATVVLGLQSSLMIDLPWVALCTAAFAAYREGVHTNEPRWFWGAGIAMGMAVETKYPSAFLVPVLLLHQWRNGWRPAFLIPLVSIVVGIEGWLALKYNGPHLLAVWASREVVARGELDDRLLGALTRGALLPCTLGLLLARPRHIAIGLGIAAATLAWARPDLDGNGLLLVLVTATLGAAALSRAAGSVIASPYRRRKGDRDDGILLGGAVLATFLAVVLVHNYAASRYLLPAATPLAILVARAAEEVRFGKRVQVAAAATGATLALLLAMADWRYGAASVEVATRAAEAAGTPPGSFKGEWGARAVLEGAGWKRLVEDDTASAGSKVIVLRQSGGAVPKAWEPLQSLESTDRFPFRVVDVRAHIGTYAETLGALPFGIGNGPLEAAVVYEVRR